MKVTGNEAKLADEMISLWIVPTEIKKGGLQIGASIEWNKKNKHMYMATLEAV